MYCNNCGKEIFPISKFCPYCGAKTDLKSHEASPPKAPVVPLKQQPHKDDKTTLIQLYLWLAAICILFAFSPLIVPPILGFVLFVLFCVKLNKIKKKNDNINNIDDYREKVETECSIIKEEAMRYKASTEKELLYLKDELKRQELDSNYRLSLLDEKKAHLEQEIKALNDEMFENDVDVFVDDKVTSEEYKDKLSVLSLREKEMLQKNESVAIDSPNTKKVIAANVKQIIRCFNSEASTIISAVTDKNISTMRNKLQRAYETINKIFNVDGLHLTEAFYQNKLEQLNTMYQYELVRAREREEQAEIRKQMLEEEKVRREIEKEKQKIEKEENQFKNEIKKLMEYLQKADSIEKQLYVDKIQELENKLKLLEKDKENVNEREQNTRAGYVYIISNVGSFGESVYKIGMTRRLEPMDRVKELGSASVPFEFDVHAMIFSEDAPTLENVLHTQFRNCAVNRVNDRKEFFRVSLDAIEKTVKENHNATVIFTRIAKAEQYRQTIEIQKREQATAV